MKPMQIDKDLQARTLTITRYFNAPRKDVWRAWTESELLDEWWAPRPWKTETKSMDFREGGYWLYAMVGPDNTRHWARVDYSKIDTHNSFQGTDAFCDEQGNPNGAAPSMTWRNQFSDDGSGTVVTVNIQFKTEQDLKTIMEMGFEAGFTSALGNLDYYLSTGFKLRKDMKPDNRARVATYLNFPGNTEEAFNFYKSVFNGTFTGGGLQRFGDIPPQEGAPPMSETDKNLIIHAELTILGGHVLMATDAPESMGFKIAQGNNMHINLEPESREETERIFNALSAGGNVTMPLSDMFWGAYFASFTDKYGINWMLNYQQK